MAVVRVVQEYMTHAEIIVITMRALVLDWSNSNSSHTCGITSKPTKAHGAIERMTPMPDMTLSPLLPSNRGFM